MRSIELREVLEKTAPEKEAFGSVAVMDANPRLAVAVSEALSARGFHAQVTDNPVVRMDTLVITEALGEGNASDVHWRVLEQARMFREAGGRSLVFLQDTGGRFAVGPTQGWRGGMAALAKTALLEWPEMAIRCIDVAVDPENISGTARRLTSALGSAHSVVGIDLSGQRCVMQAGEPLQPPRQNALPASVSDGPVSDVWLVSGGARGVTAACVQALAQRTPGRFALLGRSELAEWPAGIKYTDDIKELRRLLAAHALASGSRPVPKEIEQAARQALAGQEIRDTLLRFESIGVSALYYPCDISDKQQVHDVVEGIQQELGAITGLVHGAGVLADSMLIDKTRAQFDRVFSTKVGGLYNLLAALGDTPLSHAALFSSAAAFYGNVGQADYAMANEILNRVALSLKLRWPEASVKSFNWGPWESGMVDETLAAYFKERGIGLIPVEQGAALFADEMLSEDCHQVELLVGDVWATSQTD
ncbi:MAG: SDR family NAD(P)-dependent oxidoreductase [Granulosicoccus sp.]